MFASESISLTTNYRYVNPASKLQVSIDRVILLRCSPHAYNTQLYVGIKIEKPTEDYRSRRAAFQICVPFFCFDVLILLN